MSEIYEFKNGLNKEKEFFGKGTPIINYTDVYKNITLNDSKIKGLVEVTDSEIERFSALKGDVFFTRTSETKEEVGMTAVLLEDIENCVFSGFLIRARPLAIIIYPPYLAHYFKTTKARLEIIRYASLTTRATTTGPKLGQILIPIPPLAEQKRIANILDRFEALTTDLSEGLPAEIAAVQEQYEYYRNKLLTFNRLSA